MPLKCRNSDLKTHVNPFKTTEKPYQKVIKDGTITEKISEKTTRVEHMLTLERFTANCSPSRNHIQAINTKYSLIHFIGLKFYLLVILLAEFITWIILKICLNNINLSYNLAILISHNIHYIIPKNIQLLIPCHMNIFIICQVRWSMILPSLLLLFVIFWRLISHLPFALSQIIVPHNVKVNTYLKNGSH